MTNTKEQSLSVKPRNAAAALTGRSVVGASVVPATAWTALASEFAADDKAIWSGERVAHIGRHLDRMGKMLSQNIAAGKFPIGIDNAKPQLQPDHLAMCVARTLHVQWPSAFADGRTDGQLLSDGYRKAAARASSSDGPDAGALRIAHDRILARTLRDACTLLAADEAWSTHSVDRETDPCEWITSAELKNKTGIEPDTVAIRAKRNSWPTRKSGRLAVYRCCDVRGAWPTESKGLL